MGASPARVRRRLSRVAAAAFLVVALLPSGLTRAAADDRIDPGPELLSGTGIVAGVGIRVPR